MRLDTSRIFTTQVDGQSVILDAADSTYLQTNASGTVLVEALVRGTSLAELISLLQHEFSVDEATARRDCEAFMADVTERGWLVHEDGHTQTSDTRPGR